jgi:RND family efflux transporter MFP subunit
MPDRVLTALAMIPMLAGALLLVTLQRAPAVRLKASAQRPAEFVSKPGGTRAAWPGVVVARHTAELASDLDGRVTQVWVSAGARVTKGQPLLQVDSSEAQNAEAIAGAELGQRRSEIARARARWEEARAQLARLQQGGSWIAARELEAARAAERVAQADMLAARAGISMGRAKLAQQQLRSRRHTLEAPFDGVLVSCDVDPGDSVAARQILARVITDERQIRFAIPREQLPPAGLLDVLLALPDGDLPATIEGLQPELDPAAQLIFATATPPLAQGASLMPGTRVEVRPSAGLEPTSVRGDR